MDDLIARLEKATGPDRMLDHAIELDRTKDDLNYGIFPAPEYTKLIDAALTLVPEGRRWQVRNSEEETFGFFAVVWGVPGSKLATWDQHGPTPALALCIAALKARERAG